eukprot:1350479-Rhodomonas_salina.3
MGLYLVLIEHSVALDDLRDQHREKPGTSQPSAFRSVKGLFFFLPDVDDDDEEGEEEELPALHCHLRAGTNGA